MRSLILLLVVAFSPLGLSAEKDTFKTHDNWVTRYIKSGGHVEDVTGYKPMALESKPKYVNLRAAQQLPTSFDWRDKIVGGLSPIKNQGNCGSCWSFSITAVVSDLLKIKDATSTPNLSEQTLVDCSAYDCNGGDFDAFNYVQRTGLADRSAYPYTASNGRCKVTDGMKMQKVVSWAYVGEQGREPTTEQIKTAIMTYGPVSVDVAADDAFMSYESGIYNRCSLSQINHMTNLVGWNDEGGYWLMRNSWGTDWGENGYMKIKYTDSRNRKCNYIGETTAFAILE